MLDSTLLLSGSVAIMFWERFGCENWGERTVILTATIREDGMSEECRLSSSMLPRYAFVEELDWRSGTSGQSSSLLHTQVLW